jgi:4'-phosphopantetheinyl transferase
MLSKRFENAPAVSARPIRITHTVLARQRLRAPFVRPRLPLRPGETHVWLCQPNLIDDGALVARYAQLLSPAERERAEQFAFDADRLLYLVAHALMRCTLSRYANPKPQDWVFIQNQYGRPEIAPGLCDVPLRFNLSHTSGLAACAVTLQHDIGVDVEYMNRRGDVTALAGDVFSPAEVRALRAAPSARRREQFFKYWTLKEAYIKARGMGLAMPLDQFSFDLNDDGNIGIAFDSGLHDDPSDWKFGLHRPTPDHILAFGTRCSPGSTPSIQIHYTIPLRG